MAAGPGYDVDRCETIESYFKMRPGASVTQKLHTCAPKAPQLLCEVAWIVIDEFSQVSGANLLIMSKVLSKCLRVDEPFGGINVLFSGDPRQSSAVDGDDIMSHDAFIRLPKVCVRLTENMRQIRGDDVYSADFQCLLDNLRRWHERPLCDTAANFIDYCLFDSTSKHNADRLLCCTNKRVKAENWMRAMKDDRPIVVSPLKNPGPDSIKAWPMFIGGPVRMTRNQKNQGGRGYTWTNQQSGILVDIRGDTSPINVMGKIAEKITPNGKVIAVVRLKDKEIKVPIEMNGDKPLVVGAYARTISSVQGMTHRVGISGRLHVTFYDWNPKLQPALPYVGLSRIDDPK